MFLIDSYIFLSFDGAKVEIISCAGMGCKVVSVRRNITATWPSQLHTGKRVLKNSICLLFF